MKKISSIILTLVLLLTFSQNVFAIQYFSDIEYNDWYYNDILALSDKELVNGYTDGTFKPNNFITRAEALKLIIPMSNTRLLRSNQSEWYSDYLHTALINNYCSKEFSENINKPINRYEVAELIVKAMKFTPKQTFNAPKKPFKPFVDTDDYYVNTLYEFNIIAGIQQSDGLYYMGDKSLTRAEMVTIIKRIMQEHNGEKFYNNIHYDFLFNKKVSQPNEPLTIDEIKQLLAYMVLNNQYEITLKYENNLNQNIIKTFNDNLLSILSNELKYDLEVFSHIKSARSETNTMYETNLKTGEEKIKYIEIKVTLKTGEDIDTSKIAEQQKKTIFEAIKIYYQLRDEGKITDNMNEYDKAKIYYEWFAKNVTYDNLNVHYQSTHLPYSAFVKKAATCEGYTGAYNLLLKLEGIKTGFAINYGHIWTIAKLDGKIYEIDATGSDAEPTELVYGYFGLSHDEMEQMHETSFDISDYGKTEMYMPR